MIKEKFWDDFKTKKIGVECDTFSKSEIFTNEFVKNVNSLDRPICDYEFNTSECIIYDKYSNSWCFYSKDCCIDEGFTIVNYDDILDDGENECNKEFKIIALVGCSASGKDFILAKLKDLKFKPIISHTNRPMRPGEIEGQNYYFIDNQEAEEMLCMKKFIEHRVYHSKSGEDWIYGISEKSILEACSNKNTSVVIVDYKGLKELKKYLKSKGLEDNLTSVYINASPQTRLLRSLNREGEMANQQVEEVIRRYNDDKVNVEPAIFHCNVAIRNETEKDLKNVLSIIKAIAEV